MYRIALLANLIIVELAVAQESGMIPVSEVVSLAGWMRYPIFGILIVGIALIIAEFMKIRLSYGQTRPIMDFNMEKGALEDLEKMTQRFPTNPIGKLFTNLCAHVRLTGGVESYNSDLEYFSNTVHDRFLSFRNWMTFLSDAAGALGLLGTVLGMFQTFFGGTLDKEKILHGMGIALVTTLLGLIVSLVLNFFTTVVMNRFNWQRDRVISKADSFRNRVLKERLHADSAD